MWQENHKLEMTHLDPHLYVKVIKLLFLDIFLWKD